MATRATIINLNPKATKKKLILSAFIEYSAFNSFACLPAPCFCFFFGLQFLLNLVAVYVLLSMVRATFNASVTLLVFSQKILSILS